MTRIEQSLIFIFSVSLFLLSFSRIQATSVTSPSGTSGINTADSARIKFWEELNKLCGYAYRGVVVAGAENDTLFSNRELIMHIRSCDPGKIRIPFFAGSDSSRTWVLTLNESGLELKHDHRQRDGTPDEITMYGGSTSNSGSAFRQIFPADQETASLLPAAIGNVWWLDLIPGEYFSYNLRRVGTERFFSVRFDLTQPVPPPGEPWGWTD